MKFLKICAIALSMGVFTAACRNNDNCPAVSSDSSSAMSANQGNENEDLNATANAPANTDNAESGKGSNNNESNAKSVAGANKGRTWNANYKSRRRDTAKGPDLEASKKRERNFTSGTGADYPGK